MTYQIAGKMVPLGDGVSAKEIENMLEKLPEEKIYIPMEVSVDNTTLYCFVTEDFYYQEDCDDEFDRFLRDVAVTLKEGNVYTFKDEYKAYITS